MSKSPRLAIDRVFRSFTALQYACISLPCDAAMAAGTIRELLAHGAYVTTPSTGLFACTPLKFVVARVVTELQKLRAANAPAWSKAALAQDACTAARLLIASTDGRDGAPPEAAQGMADMLSYARDVVAAASATVDDSKESFGPAVTARKLRLTDEEVAQGVPDVLSCMRDLVAVRTPWTGLKALWVRACVTRSRPDDAAGRGAKARRICAWNAFH